MFFAIVLSIFGGAHFLVGARLASLLQLAPSWRIALWSSLGVLMATSIGSAVLARTAVPGPWWAELVVRVGFAWMGFVLLFFAASLASAVVSGVGHFLPNTLAGGIRSIGIGFFAIALLGGIWGLVSAARAPRIHEVELRLEGLPRAFDGYRIAHITDTHIGPILRRDWTESLARRVDSAKADLVVHTGDLVDGSLSRMAESVEPLGRISARDGKVFVTGNHESYSGLLDWSDYARKLGYRVLENEHFAITRGVDTLVIAGVTDHHEGQHVPQRAPDARKAFEGSPAGFRILLAHQPVQALSAQNLTIGLQLSGHTHGGQIWPFHHLVRLVQPIISGFGKVGDVPIFVSNGAGYWGPPMRLFAPNEVPILVLRSIDPGRQNL